jgi:5-oxoprolinase (ATP-hydrolysing) subunit A
MRPDINCDMGEGTGNDELIMPFITSANIACGYHAGDPETMWKTVELAIIHNVMIGAHPSFLDRNKKFTTSLYNN